MRKDSKEGTQRQILWKWNHRILIHLITSFNATTLQTKLLSITTCITTTGALNYFQSYLLYVKIKSTTYKKENESSLEGTITRTLSVSIKHPQFVQFERRIITAMSYYQSIFPLKGFNNNLKSTFPCILKPISNMILYVKMWLFLVFINLN